MPQSEGCGYFAGLPDAFESEGFDRAHMGMPGCQNELIERVAAVPAQYHRGIT